MSALARILMEQGHQVFGSDETESPLLHQLREEGASIQIGHRETHLEADHTVVYSTAVKESNVEFLQAKKMNLPLLHRSDLLGQLMGGKKPLLITGTHGKTTTTALLSAVLMEAETDPSFVIGGILQSANTNGRFGSGAYFVAEADESDGSFLKTPSFGAIVTNLEPEHLDYWKAESHLKEAFHQFFDQVKKKTHLFWCGDDSRLQALDPPGFSYGFSEGVDLKIVSYQPTSTGSLFSFSFQGKTYADVACALFGRHNALNAAAVFGLSLTLKIPQRAIRNALALFQGTKRRLEFKGEAQGVQIYDDYGHHPTEIGVTLRALREKICEKRMVVLFQPHRFTRVRDCFQEFLSCFQDADEVILTDIYGAGEAPIEGISSAALYTRMREKLGSKLHFFPRQHLEEGTLSLLRPFDVVVTLGAGDITKAGEPLLKAFAAKAPKYRVALLCGGTSAEHRVSVQSARNIFQALDRTLYDVKLFGLTKEGEWLLGEDVFDKLEQNIRLHPGSPKMSDQVLAELLRSDVAIPVFHGPQGEDGMIQGLLDAFAIPYVGCDYRSAALCMQKAWTKHVARLHHVPTAPYLEIDAPTYRKNPALFLERIEEQISYPVWIKATHLGSSIGVSRAANPEEVPQAVEKAFAVDDVLIAEAEVEGRQIEFAVLGNEVIQMGEPCEIQNHGAFYDFDKKYGPEAIGVEIPAQLTPLERQIGEELAEKMYRAAGCKGLARIDFFLDKEGHFWLNEINPFPGFTQTSGYPKMWEARGLSQTALLNSLVVLALHRSRKLAQIRGA